MNSDQLEPLIERAACIAPVRTCYQVVIMHRVKLPVIQYMLGLRRMRQTIRETEANTAYRWFPGLDIHDPIPHFSTFGKRYSRRFIGKERRGVCGLAPCQGASKQPVFTTAARRPDGLFPAIHDWPHPRGRLAALQK